MKRSISILAYAWMSFAAISQAQDKSATQEKPSTSGSTQSIASLRMEQPAYRGLDASLFMQTSAEYRACCLQAYRWATILVDQKVKARTNKSKQPAVVLDLDETVLDNGVYQAEQIRSKFGFDQNAWAKWEDHGSDRVRLVPGAKAFIDHLRELGVQPFYISNRNDRARAETMRALKRFGLEVPEDQLLCADATTGSTKTSRREKATNKFDVLLFVGDNLRDFDDRFKFNPAAGIEKRSDEVDATADKFGIEWIIIPNPSYGEWNRAFSNTEHDIDLLYK